MRISKASKLLVSFLIIVIGAATIFFFFYPSQSTLGRSFDVSIIFIIVRLCSLVLGLLGLLLRIIKIIRNTQLVYILFGSLNCLIGIFCIYLYFTGRSDLAWLHKCLLNLLLGIILLADSFLINASSASQKN